MVDNLYVVTPRGFCAGVEMAIKALTWMLKIYDEPVYLSLIHISEPTRP